MEEQEQVGRDSQAAVAEAEPESPDATVGDGENGAGDAQEGDGASPASSRMTALAAQAREQRGDGVITVAEATAAEEDELREAAAAGEELEDPDWEKVQDWLLSDQVDVTIRRLDLKVGGTDKDPVFLPWIIKAIPIEVIRQAEREARGNPNRAQRRGAAQQQAAQYDELRANLRIIVEGTHLPDIKKVAVEQGIGDPTELLRRKLAYRPGLIARVAGEILNLSGFDDADVRAAEN